MNRLSIGGCVLLRSCGVFTSQFLLVGAILAIAALPAALGKEPTPISPIDDHKLVAIDAKGIRHNLSEYSIGYPPWLGSDLVSPRLSGGFVFRVERGIGGTGFFHLDLDPKLGAVVKVTKLQGTESPYCDEIAVRVLGKWRWRPERWKQFDMKITFETPRSERMGPQSLWIGRQ